MAHVKTLTIYTAGDEISTLTRKRLPKALAANRVLMYAQIHAWSFYY
jgi:hypothetical protein